jgi:alpha-tubulin suppressor-like RCC1 family protein
VPSLSGVVQVAVGWEHTCALKSGGSVVCWGDNTYGQLGNGTTMAGKNPISNVQVIDDAASITAAFFETCVIRRDTTVYCWGLNTHGELGDGTTMNRSSPVMTMTMTGTSALAIGGYDTVGPLSHMCAAGTDDSVWCWGSNAFGEIGNGVTQDQLTPSRVTGLGLAALVSAGGRHSCAVIPGSPVSCCGANDVSQLGNGGTASSLMPTPSLFACP